MVYISVRLRQLIVCYFVLCVCSHGARQKVDVGEAEAEGCDPDFRKNVEKCLHSLQGFHVMTRHKTLRLGDWDRTDLICMFQLTRVVVLCLNSIYALNPLTKRWRSLCGFHSLDPTLLNLYGQAVCRNKEVLKTHGECLNKSQGVLQSCVYGYHARAPSRLSVGMYKEPLHSPHCSYHAYTEHCYEKRMFRRCSIDLYYAHLDILKSTRPPTCSWQTIDFLKRRFRETESYIVYYSSSDWAARYVTIHLIGAVVAVCLVTKETLGVG
ncbi:hypothetical protein ACOMHN_043377 [Nucella lapillus]